jgi:ribosomal protein L19E
MVQKALSLPTLRNLIDRAANDPQRMRARKIEAKIIEKMPSRVWLSCTAVSRLIRSPDDRKIRARLDRLVRDGKIERKREQGSHGTVYLFRRPS